MSGTYRLRGKPGDILLIYRNGERYPKRYSSVVSGVAIIEEIIRTNSVEECVQLCNNRSIFTTEEIKGFYPKYSVVIKLLAYKSFKNKVTLDSLYENEIVEEGSGSRPFEILTKKQFEAIYKLGMEE